MKRYLLIFALLLGAVCSYAQGTTGQAAVLQQCLTAPQVSKLLTFDPTGVPVSLYAVQGDAAIPEGVNYFGKELQLTTETEVVRRNISTYFRFSNITITGNTAQVSFEVWYNLTAGKQVKEFSIRLQNTGNQWNIVETNEIGR